VDCKYCGSKLELVWQENPVWPTADNIYRCTSCDTYWLETFPESRQFASVLQEIPECEVEEVKLDEA